MFNGDFATFCESIQPEQLGNKYPVPKIVHWLETKITEPVILYKSALYHHIVKECKYAKSRRNFATLVSEWIRKGTLKSLVCSGTKLSNVDRGNKEICVRVSDGEVLLSSKHVKESKKGSVHVSVVDLNKRKRKLLAKIQKDQAELDKLEGITPAEWKKMKEEERARENTKSKKKEPEKPTKKKKHKTKKPNKKTDQEEPKSSSDPVPTPINEVVDVSGIIKDTTILNEVEAPQI
jgi:hypothetical protein